MRTYAEAAAEDILSEWHKDTQPVLRLGVKDLIVKGFCTGFQKGSEDAACARLEAAEAVYETKTREDILDDASRPLRDACTQWARWHCEGFSGGWDRDTKSWVYKLVGFLIFVEVLEDGSGALVGRDVFAPLSFAKTPRGLRRLLNRLYQGGLNDPAPR